MISADYQGNVFALAAEDGRRVWNRKLPEKVVSSPCVGDGEVLVGCYNGLAYALSAETGRVLWRIRTGGKIRGSCAYGVDGEYNCGHDQRQHYGVLDRSWARFIPEEGVRSRDCGGYVTLQEMDHWRVVAGLELEMSPGFTLLV